MFRTCALLSFLPPVKIVTKKRTFRVLACSRKSIIAILHHTALDCVAVTGAFSSAGGVATVAGDLGDRTWDNSGLIKRRSTISSKANQICLGCRVIKENGIMWQLTKGRST